MMTAAITGLALTTRRARRDRAMTAGTRDGKNTVYALYDNHVARLLDEAVYHSEHLRLGLHDPAQRGDAAVITA